MPTTTHMCASRRVGVKQFMLVVQNVKHVNQKSFARRPACHGAYELASQYDGSVRCGSLHFSSAVPARRLSRYSNAYICNGELYCLSVAVSLALPVAVASLCCVLPQREVDARTRQLHTNFDHHDASLAL